MKHLIPIFILIVAIGCKETSKKTNQVNNTPTPNTEVATINNTTAYSFALTNIDGKSFSLKDYAGKKILIVNTASKCGFTKQYEGLQALSEKYKDKLVVIGFPCNDFNGQEPGNEEEIKGFCKKNYGVTFPLSQKINVKGENIAPLYNWLTQKSLNGVLDATVKWNFNKFLLNEKGELLAYFPSNITPLDEAITKNL